MKKTLMISMNDSSYQIKYGINIIEVSKDSLLLQGKELYDKIFNDVVIGEILEIDYKIEKNIIDSKDVRIVNDIIKVLDSIKDKINEKINKSVNN